MTRGQSRETRRQSGRRDTRSDLTDALAQTYAVDEQLLDKPVADRTAQELAQGVCLGRAYLWTGHEAADQGRSQPGP